METELTADSAVVTDLDKGLIRALQIDPRATYSRLADVLGVSEQTVARRYGRLRREGLLRVVGAVDPRALGQIEWMVRLHCRPDSAPALSEALARREDVSWVTINSGGAEVQFALRSRSDADSEDLLVRRLPKSAPVLDTAAAVVMHRYDSGDWEGFGNALTGEQLQRLTATPAVPASRTARLEPGDHALLDLLARDGRTSYAVLARELKTSVGRITRRIDTLHAGGVIYFDIDIALAVIGPVMTASIWVQLPPERLDAVGKAVARHQQVQFAAAITGDDNFVAVVTVPTIAELHDYVTGPLAAVEGIGRYKLTPVLRRIKQAGALTIGDRLAPG